MRTFLLCLHRRRQTEIAMTTVSAGSITAADAEVSSLPSLPQGVLHEVLDLAATPLSPWRHASAAEEEAEAERRRLGGVGVGVGVGGGSHYGDGAGWLGSPLDAVMGGLDMDALGAFLPR